MKTNKGLDREMILICGLVALLISISVIFAIMVWFELDFSQCDSTFLVSSFSVLTGGIWGALLCKNC